MDENRPPYRLHTPATADSAASYELPAQRDAPGPRRRPGVDEHEIRPEVERRDMIGGEILPSATAQSQLAAWAESSDSDNESFSAAAVAASLRGGEGGSTPSAPGSQSKTVSFVE